MKIIIPGDSPITVYPAGGMSMSVPGEVVVDVNTPGLTWLLNDNFTTALAAGDVDGTLSDSGHVRTVVTDSGSKLSLSGGDAVFDTGAGTGDPTLGHVLTFTRQHGLVLFGKHTNPIDAISVGFGWATRTNPTDIAHFEGVVGWSSAHALQIFNPTISLGSLTKGTYYNIALQQRINGYAVLIKGGTQYPNCTLVYISNSGSTATLHGRYMSLANAKMNAAYMRVPLNPIPLTPLLSDGFNGTWPITDGFGSSEFYVKGTVIGHSFVEPTVIAMNASNGAFVTVDEKGTSTETLTQIEARFNTDVVLNINNPKFCVIIGGVNDINAAASDPNSTMQAKIQSMVSMAVSANITPVLTTISPYVGWADWSADRQTWTDTYNAWIAAYAAANSYLIYDMWTALVDPETPNTLLPAYDSGDHLHPSAAGYTKIANDILTTLPINTGVFVPQTISAGGSGLTWTARLGTWGSAAGVASCSELDGSGIGIATATLNTADVWYSCVLGYVAGSGGVIVRYEDAANYSYVINDGTNVKLFEVTTASAYPGTQRGTAVKAPAAGARLIVDVSGAAVRVYYNEALLYAYASAVNTTAKTIGLITSNIGNTFNSTEAYTKGEYSILDRYSRD